jgi:hypothetical protein
VLRLALPTLIVWLVCVFAADLSAGVAISGAVAACVLGWWEKQKGLAVRADAVEYAAEFEDEEDESFEQHHPPVFYV